MGFGPGDSGLRNSRDGAQGGLGTSDIVLLVRAFGPTAQAHGLLRHPTFVRMHGAESVRQCPA